MNIYVVCSITAAIICWLLVVFIYRRSRGNRARTYFALVTALIGIWTLYPVITSLPISKQKILLLTRFIYAPAIFVPSTFFSFMYYVLKLEEDKLSGIILRASYTVATLLTLMAFTSFFIRDVRFIPGTGVVPGPLYIFFMVYFGFMYTYASTRLLWRYQRAADHYRTQLKYVGFAYAIAFISGIIHFLSSFNIREIFPHDIFVVTYTLIMTYAIIRHQLMDINIVIKKTLVFAGLFSSVYGVITLFTFLSQIAFEKITGGNRWFFLIPSLAVIVLMLRPLENFLIRVSDRYLFQKKYNYKELLKSFSDDVLSVMDLRKILNETLNSLMTILRIETCGIILLDRNEDIFKMAASRGLKKRNMMFYRDSLLVTYLQRTRLHLMNDKEIQQLNKIGTIREILKNLQAELVLPLLLHDSLVGAITLGSKKSGEPYTQDDLDILVPLSRSEAVAISNAQAMEDLSKTQAEAAQREKMAVIGTLAAGINHEICNPLGIARGQCEVFLLNAKDGLYETRAKEEQIYEAMKIMEKVIKETDRATSITKKLSSFAKPGKGDINEDVDISNEIDEVMSLVGHDLELNKIKFNKNIPNDFPHIRADRKQLQEILFNLIRNAAQAIEGQGNITVKATKDDRSVFIDIEDTGKGIPENRLDQIFNPFYTTKAPGKGTGLGLFIVRQIIQRNRGAVTVRSKEGEGTTFTLQFPLPQYV